MKHIFETYFERIRAFISENTDAIDNNLLIDGDFEEPGGWELSGGARLTYAARFSGRRGLYFDGEPAGASQTIRNRGAGLRAFHFFLSGICGVRIRGDNGKFWNATATANNYILDWQDEPFVNTFERPEWGDVFCFVRLDEPLSWAGRVHTGTRCTAPSLTRYGHAAYGLLWSLLKKPIWEQGRGNHENHAEE